LAPFTAHYAELVDDICDGCIGSSITFQDIYDKVYTMEMTNDDNDMSMMNIDANVLDYIKYFVGTSNILES
jgi:hypothetical protein